MRLSQWQKAALMAALLLNTTAVDAEQAKADVSNKIKTSETIVLGYRADALPFSYRNTHGQATGYAVEFCKAAVKVIENRLGIKRLNIVWKEVNNTNRFSEIEKGNIDLECSDTTNTVERHKLVDFGPTYFVGNTAIAVNNKSTIQTINQLQGQTIAVARNTTFVESLKQFRVTTGISFKESLEPSYQASINAVTRGAAAATILDRLILSSHSKQNNSQDLRLLEQNIGTEAYAAILKKGDATFRELITDAFTTVMSSGKAINIYDQWFTQPIPGTGINYNLPISKELKALFTVQRPEAVSNISHIQIFSNPSSSGEELIHAFSQMEMLTGDRQGSIAITPQQTAAIKALVEPYLDNSAMIQRANGRRYNKSSYVPAYTDNFIISDVQVTKPSNGIVVARYNKQSRQALPDSGTLMSLNKTPRLTVFRWNPNTWNWLVVSHASFNTPLASICNTKPIEQSPLQSNTSSEDYKLGIQLFEQYLKQLRAKNLQPVVDPEVQFQSASGRGATSFKANRSKIGTFEGTTYKDVVITRNNDILVLSLNVKHKRAIYQGALEIKNDYNPILWTFRQNTNKEWKLIAAATFAPAKNLPSGSKCVPAQ